MRMYSDKEVDKIIKKCRRQCLKDVKGDLEEIITKFSHRKYLFSSYDSYFASRMLLTEFYDKTSTTDYLQFIFDIASEHLELEDWAVLKEFIKSYTLKYKALSRRLKDVSITE
jgi:hypothetical protein